MNKRKFGPWWLLLFFWAELCFMELVVHAATAPQFWQPELESQRYSRRRSAETWKWIR